MTKQQPQRKHIWNGFFEKPMEVYEFPTNEMTIGAPAGMTDGEHFRYYFCYKLENTIWQKYSVESLRAYIAKKSGNICKMERLEKVGKYTIITNGVHADVPAQQAIDLFELLLTKYAKYGCFLTNANKPNEEELDEIFSNESLNLDANDA